MKRSPRVVLVDFGAGYADQTARIVFEMGYAVCIVRDGVDLVAQIGALIDRSRDGNTLVILPACDLNDNPRIDPGLLEIDVPFLGICNGCQLIARALGGQVRDIIPEEGQFEFRSTSALARRNLVEGLPDRFIVSMFHRQAVVELPSDLIVLGSTDRSPIAAFASRDWRLVGYQFHPESARTEYGGDILAQSIGFWLGPAFRWRRAGARWLMRMFDRLVSP